MITFSTILQGYEAELNFAYDFALSFDFSEDETEEFNYSYFDCQFIDCINGIQIYYNKVADYYFFSSDEIN